MNALKMLYKLPPQIRYALFVLIIFSISFATAFLYSEPTFAVIYASIMLSAAAVFLPELLSWMGLLCAVRDKESAALYLGGIAGDLAPSNVYVTTQRATIYARLLMPQKTVDTATPLLRYIKPGAQILNTLANAHLQIGDYEKSLKYCEELISKFPRVQVAKINKALALIGLGRLDEAQETLDSLRGDRLWADYVKYLTFSCDLDRTGIETAETNWRHANVKNKYIKMAGEAALAMNKSDFTAVLELTSNNKLNDRETVISEFYRSLAYAALGEGELAYGSINQILSLRAEILMAYVAEATILLDTGLTEMLQNAFKEVERRSPQHKILPLLRAHLHLEANQYDEAFKHIEEALSKQYARSETLSVKARILAKMNQPGEALENAKQAMKLNIYSAGVWQAQSEALLAAGNTKEALESARKAVSIAAHSPSVFETLADVLEADGLKIEAEQARAKANQLRESFNKGVLKAAHERPYLLPDDFMST